MFLSSLGWWLCCLCGSHFPNANPGECGIKNMNKTQHALHCWSQYIFPSISTERERSPCTCSATEQCNKWILYKVAIKCFEKQNKYRKKIINYRTPSLRRVRDTLIESNHLDARWSAKICTYSFTHQQVIYLLRFFPLSLASIWLSASGCPMPWKRERKKKRRVSGRWNIAEMPDTYLQRSVTFEPSRTITSLELNESSMFGGTIVRMQVTLIVVFIVRILRENQKKMRDEKTMLSAREKTGCHGMSIVSIFIRVIHCEICS